MSGKGFEGKGSTARNPGKCKRGPRAGGLKGLRKGAQKGHKRHAKWQPSRFNSQCHNFRVWGRRANDCPSGYKTYAMEDGYAKEYSDEEVHTFGPHVAALGGVLSIADVCIVCSGWEDTLPNPCRVATGSRP